MKITDVRVICANRSVFCRIDTDEGISGLGESGTWGFLEASARAILVMKEYLVGRDPLAVSIPVFAFPRSGRHGSSVRY